MLKERARRGNRSLQAEVRDLIIRGADEKSGDAVIAWARSVRPTTPIDLELAFSMLREDRGTR